MATFAPRWQSADGKRLFETEEQALEYDDDVLLREEINLFLGQKYPNAGSKKPAEYRSLIIEWEHRRRVSGRLEGATAPAPASDPVGMEALSTTEEPTVGLDPIDDTDVGGNL